MPEAKEGGCEGSDTCCLVFPLKTGVTILSILSVIWGAFQIWSIFSHDVGGAWRFGVIIAAIPTLIADYLFLKWLMDDNKENRDNLPRAALLNMFSVIAITIWGAIIVIFFSGAKFSDELNYILLSAG